MVCCGALQAPGTTARREPPGAEDEALTSQSAQTCRSCDGQGTVFRDYGPEPCASCLGLGLLPSASVLTERRLREIEKIYEGRDLEAGQHVRWLASEVRRAHHALLQILAASQDLTPDDSIALKIRFLANDVLSVYPPAPREKPDDPGA